jgi:hypothetical protein
MKRKGFAIIIVMAFAVTGAVPHTIIAQKQTRNKPKLQCTSENTGGEPMTYLVGASKLSRKEKKRIKEKWGTLIVPKGETERAKQIRANAISYNQSLIKAMAASVDIWSKANPKATTEQIEERRKQSQDIVDYMINKNNADIMERLAAKSWDWSAVLDVDPVLNQGAGCNTCWAFAATSAAALSMQKNFLDTIRMRDYMFPDKTTGELSTRLGPVFVLGNLPAPFAQDLLNCMPVRKEEICQSGWHGLAFDFMVYGNGVPNSYVDGFVIKDEITGKETVTRRQYKRGEKFSCQPSAGFSKASSWDYVNSPPDKLPTVEQLKTALVEHGPIVAPIFYDECLANYKGGVFNEKDLGIINHVVLLIGWDDDKQAWRVKNSWGEEWGENGFGWIKYGSNNIGVFAAWIDAGSVGG